MKDVLIVVPYSFCIIMAVFQRYSFATTRREQRLVMRSLIGYLVGYLLTPRVFVSHVISFCFFCSLARRLDDVGQLVRTVIKHEVVHLVLWLVLPAEGLAIALSLLFCLRLCDSATGIGREVQPSRVSYVSQR